MTTRARSPALSQLLGSAAVVSAMGGRLDVIGSSRGAADQHNSKAKSRSARLPYGDRAPSARIFRHCNPSASAAD